MARILTTRLRTVLTIISSTTLTSGSYFYPSDAFAASKIKYESPRLGRAIYGTLKHVKTMAAFTLDFRSDITDYDHDDHDGDSEEDTWSIGLNSYSTIYMAAVLPNCAWRDSPIGATSTTIESEARLEPPDKLWRYLV